MKILVIGKNGFIAKNIAEYFSKKEGYETINLGSSDLNLLDENSVRTILADERFDVVFNTAVYNPGTSGSSDREVEYDLKMFHNVAKYSSLYDKMIYFGSGSEYDKRFPICTVTEKDLYDMNSGKSSGFIPVNPYGCAKYTIGREIEGDVFGRGNIYNLRLFGLFGKYENWKITFISGACCKALKNLPITIRKDVYFDYLYIDDFLEMLEKFINLDNPSYKTYNFTSGRRILLTELADLVKSVSGKNVPIYICNEGLANEYTSSNERIINELGGYSFESYEESITKLYRWYESIADQIDNESLLYQ